MSGFSPARSPNNNANPERWAFDVDELADEAEEQLRDHLREEYDREPTDEEVEWARGYPRRIAEKADGRDPRIPTFAEMKKQFGWGPSNSLKEWWGEDFTERKTSSPDLNYR
jgi:membrane-bound lytic murein transglycosylase MltF